MFSDIRSASGRLTRRYVAMRTLAFPLCCLLAALNTTAHADARSVAEQQDVEVVAQLRGAGVDLSREHEVDFFLVFPTKASADKATAKIVEMGYTFVAAQGDSARGWQVHLKRSMLVSAEAMVATTRSLSPIAESFGGFYDGWGMGAGQ